MYIETQIYTNLNGKTAAGKALWVYTHVTSSLCGRCMGSALSSLARSSGLICVCLQDRRAFKVRARNSATAEFGYVMSSFHQMSYCFEIEHGRILCDQIVTAILSKPV